MSGCGRKHRAKHLTQQYLDDAGWDGPAKGDQLAICLEAPQSKAVKVRLVAPPALVKHDARAAAVGSIANDEPSSSPPSQASSPSSSIIIHASLPGKFHKVMWLGTNDVIVVRDGAVLQKPSPEQLRRFYNEQPAWAKAVAAVSSSTHGSCVSDASTLPYVAPGPAPDVEVQAVTTPMSLSPQVKTASETPNNDDTDEDEHNNLMMMENPNRNNITHRATHFGDEDEDDDDDDESDSD